MNPQQNTPPAADVPGQLELFGTTPAKLAQVNAFAQDISAAARASNLSKNRAVRNWSLSSAQITWLQALVDGREPKIALKDHPEQGIIGSTRYALRTRNFIDPLGAITEAGRVALNASKGASK